MAMDIRILMSKILAAVTGVEYTTDTLAEAGERIFNLRRAVMVLREDRTREEDTLNHYFFERLLGGAESLAAPLNKEQFEALKDRYYALCGWDVKTGRPARAKLEQLGMKAVADKLQNAGKLG